MMKKILGIILAAMMLVLPACAAFADEIPEPEGGKKFDTDWAIFGMTVSIVYEEEGYRVDIREYDPAEQKGTVWEYACKYNEEKDVLESVASLKYGFSDKEGAESVDEFEYDDLDAENQVTVFAIDENGMLTWQDGRGQDGMDLVFSDIGRFDGTWVNQEKNLWVEISWNDSEEGYGYDVLIHSEAENAAPDIVLKGLYNAESQKLECLDPETYAARFDGDAGEYSLLLGNAKGVDGPYTKGTYLWIEVENWPRLEAKIVEGPYIHHCVGIHADVVPVLYEACKYIGVKPDLYDDIEQQVIDRIHGI